MSTSLAKKVFASEDASEEKYSQIADYPSHKSPWLWQSPDNWTASRVPVSGIHEVCAQAERDEDGEDSGGDYPYKHTVRFCLDPSVDLIRGEPHQVQNNSMCSLIESEIFARKRRSQLPQPSVRRFKVFGRIQPDGVSAGIFPEQIVRR
jgi:hypothetical protein